MNGSRSKVYWEKYGNTTLHTNYNYFRHNTLFKDVSSALQVDTTKFDQDLARLQAQETRFYRMFGKQSYEEFKSWVQEFLKEGDAEIIARFSNESIRQNIIRDITNEAEKHQNLSKAKITLTINTIDADKKLREITKHLYSITDLSSKFEVSKKGELVFEADPRIMKAILNRFKQKNFHITNLSSELLSSYLEFENVDLGGLSFSANGKQLSIKELSSLVKYRPFPWGYRNQEIQEAWKNSDNHTTIEKELNEAIKAIRNNIEKLAAGGSKQMKQALQETLNDVVPSTFNADKYYNIFFVGANYKNGLLGAFGEFGTALLINYLKLQGATNITSRAKVIGQELGKQDVSFEDFGVQVKNYSISQTETGAYTRKTIEVRQHPNELAQYFPDKQNFLGFMANYYFNENVQQSPYGNPRQTMDNVITKLQGEYLGELLRLAVDDLGVTDTITFYEIGSRYLVPASALLCYYKETANSLKVFIKDPPKPQYTVGEVTKGENKYWRKAVNANGEILWEPTNDNSKLYRGLISKDISFVTEMKNEFDLRNYALY